MVYTLVSNFIVLGKILEAFKDSEKLNASVKYAVCILIKQSKSNKILPRHDLF